MLTARGKRDIEDGGCNLGIVEEEFEEIAHPVEKEAIGRFRLQREILCHHRSGGSVGHSHPDSDFARRLKPVFQLQD